MNEAELIDQRKIKLEKRGQREVRKVFSNMATDAANLYKLTGFIDPRSFANNYEPDFVKVSRDILRATVNEFQGDLLSKTEKQFNCNVITKQDQALEGDEEVIDNTLEAAGIAILTQLNADMSLYISNTSEQQAAIITNTNAKMVDDAVSKSVEGLVSRQTQISAELNDLLTETSQLRAALTSNPNNAEISQRLNRAIARQEGLQEELQLIDEQSQIFIGNSIEKNINEAAEARSDLIAEQLVGFAESEVREEEANLLAEAALAIGGGALLAVKEWVSILDGKTRPAHVVADGQVVNIFSNFLVGGEALTRPRDPNGSLGNIMRCRCVAIYRLQLANQ